MAGTRIYTRTEVDALYAAAVDALVATYAAQGAGEYLPVDDYRHISADAEDAWMRFRLAAGAYREAVQSYDTMRMVRTAMARRGWAV